MLHTSSRYFRLLTLSAAFGVALSTGVAHASSSSLPKISFKNAKVTEGNTGLASMVFTATLDKAGKTPVSVNYKTIARTASASSDFKGTKGTLTFAPGETKATFTVSVVGDKKAEDNETFQVHLSGPEGATLKIVDALGVIVNDDGAPVPAPGKGKLVFAAGSQEGYGLFTMNSDGSNRTRISKDYNDRTPAWSPDGTKIAFRSYFLNPQTGNYSSGIGVMNADGSKRVQLTSGEYGYVKPVWSGDGKLLIFRTYGFGTHSGGIYSVAVKDGTLKQLTSAYDDGEPSVSRDAGKIVFLSYVYSPETNYYGYQIFSMNLDGTGRTQITSDSDSRSANFSPQISADGKTVIFVKLTGDTTTFYTINADGTNQRSIVDVFDTGLNPIISLDGKKAIFTVRYENVDTTYVVDLVKGLVDNVSEEGTAPVFSPDGKKIAFVSNRDENEEIYVMNIDGSKPTRLTSNPYFDNQPDYASGSVAIPPAAPPSSTQAVQAPASAGSSANDS